MKESDVVIVAMPQANGVTKKRPAIILREMPPFQDMLICGVSSQLHQQVDGFDEIISPNDSDFGESSLVGTSLIRLGLLSSIPQSQIFGVIGSISAARHQRLLENLISHFKTLR